MKNVTTLLRQNLGVDVSKKTLDVVISTIDLQQRVKVKASRKFNNTPSGFVQLHKWMKNKQVPGLEFCVLMEATGIYYEQLAWFLYEKEYKVTVIVPTKAKRYLQAIGNKSKTDKMDAKGLAQMGLEQRLTLWQPISKNIYALRLLTRQMEDFTNQRTVLLNQQHALGHSAYPTNQVDKSIKRLINALNKEIDKLEKSIEQLIKNDKKIYDKIGNAMLIKGVGLKTVAVLLAETNGFATFENQGQLVSYSGYDIVENESGQKRGKTRISKKGNAHIRRAMHMSSLGVVRNHEPTFVKLYERLIARGKTKMQAYVAVQRKLLILIWTLWRKNEAYDPYYYQRQNSNSGNEESKPLFSFVHKEDEKVAPKESETTQDELPYNESSEALFSLHQSY